MRGPFERLKYDLRRIWECPQCGHKVRTDGTVTSQVCRCGKPNTNPPVGMKLIGDGPRRLVPPVPKPLSETAVEPATIQVDVIAVTTPTVEVTTVDVAQAPAKNAAPPPTDAGPQS